MDPNTLQFKGWIGYSDTLTDGIEATLSSTPTRPMVKITSAREKSASSNASANIMKLNVPLKEIDLGLGGLTIGLLAAYPIVLDNKTRIMIPAIHFDDQGKPTAKSRLYGISYGEYTLMLCNQYPAICSVVSQATPQMSETLKKVVAVLNDQVGPSLKPE